MRVEVECLSYMQLIDNVTCFLIKLYGIRHKLENETMNEYFIKFLRSVDTTHLEKVF